MSDLAYTLVLIGMFVVLALALRWLNQHRQQPRALDLEHGGLGDED